MDGAENPGRGFGEGGNINIGLLLRGWRLAAGLTQEELAVTAGLSLAAIRDLEQGRRLRPRRESIDRMVSALNLDDSQAEDFRRAASVPGGQTARRRFTGQGGIPAKGHWLSVLGQLGAWYDGAPLPLGASKQRILLGALALEPNGLVHRDALVDMMWGSEPPSTAISLLHSYVSRLRKAVDPSDQGPGQLRVATVNTCYRLEVTDDRLDLLVFRCLFHRARAARQLGDLVAARESYKQAHSLWRGDPLADIDLLRDHPHVLGLKRERIDAVLGYADACMELDEVEHALSLLWAVTASEPLHEPAHARLMIALASAGQPSAAIAVYEEVRQRLDEQLGVLPAAELVGAHARVLRHEVPVVRARQEGADGIHARPAAEPPGDHPDWSYLPRQLPAGIPHFVGRARELKALGRLTDYAVPVKGAVPITVVTGTAGLGKSALALHWAHQAAHLFPDGQLFLNLRGVDAGNSPVDPEDAIRGFLDAFGISGTRLPAGSQALEGLYRSMLADKHVLIVLDNACDDDQVRPLLPGAPGCAVLVTSRSRLAGLATTHGAQTLALELFTAAEATELLAAYLGAGRLARQPAAVETLIKSCAGLPLALGIAAARVAVTPDLPLAVLVARMRDTHDLLNELDLGDTAADVRASFSWSYRQLSKRAALAFRLLGVHPGPDASVLATANLTGITFAEARKALGELASVNLLAENAQGRFACHDLLRTYAREQANATDSDAARDMAMRRVLDFYLHTANRADRLLNPVRPVVALPVPAPGVVLAEFSTAGQALAWFQEEHQVLLAAMRTALARGPDAYVWQLPWTMVTFFDRSGYWHEWAAVQRVALAASERLADTLGLACANHQLGYASVRLRAFEEGTVCLRRAFSLYQKVLAPVGCADVQSAFAVMCDRQGRPAEAMEHARQALCLYRSAGHLIGEGRALNAIGWCYALLGRYELAETHCCQALAIHRELGYSPGEAITLDSLGYIYLQLGQHSKAIDNYQRSVTLYTELGDQYHRSLTLIRLGDAHLADRNLRAAQESWGNAQEILDGLGHPDARKLRAKRAAS